MRHIFIYKQLATFMVLLVEAVMLMGSTSKEESRDIYSRLSAAASSKNRSGMTGPEIKFCYVTVRSVEIALIKTKLATEHLTIDFFFV